MKWCMRTDLGWVNWVARLDQFLGICALVETVSELVLRAMREKSKGALAVSAAVHLHGLKGLWGTP